MGHVLKQHVKERHENPSMSKRKFNWKHQLKENTNTGNEGGFNIAAAKKRSASKTKCLLSRKEEVRRLKSEWDEVKIPKMKKTPKVKKTPLKRKTPRPVVYEKSTYSVREYRDKLLRDFGFVVSGSS